MTTTRRKLRPEKMRHITRVDYEKRRQHGWWVRIQRDGKQHQRFFSDHALGNKLSALVAAEQFRDELLRHYPKPARGNNFNRTTTRNTTGIPGVTRTTTRKDGRVYQIWQAAWLLPDGRRKTKKFAFSEGGRSEREAKQLAIQARREGLELIENWSTQRPPKKRTRKQKRSVKQTGAQKQTRASKNARNKNARRTAA